MRREAGARAQSRSRFPVIVCVLLLAPALLVASAGAQELHGDGPDGGGSGDLEVDRQSGGTHVQYPDMTILMDDGAPISVRLWTPEVPWVLRPTILLLHGWGGSKSTFDAFAPGLAARGYNVLAPDARGFGSSGGLSSVAGPREIEDLQALVTWAIQVNLSEPGGIAVVGISYGAGQAWLLAAEDSRIRTIVPVAGWTNLSRALAPEGVVKLSYGLGLYAGGFRMDSGTGNYDPAVHRWMTSLVTGVGAAWAHRDLWERSVDSRLDRVNAHNVSVFAIQGWNDHLFPAEEAIEPWDLLTVEKKLALGGVGHPPADPDVRSAEAAYWLVQVQKWLDLELKGVPSDVRAGAVEVASTPWTGATANLTTLATPTQRLRGDFFGRLVANPASSDVEPLPLARVITNTFVAGLPDDPVFPLLWEEYAPFPGSVAPQNAWPRSTPADAHAFTTAALPEDLTVQGQITVRIPEFVSLTPHVQVVVRVYSVDKLDVETLRDVAVFRTGAEDLGSITSKTLDTWGHHHTYKAGERLRIRVSAEAFPMFLPERAPAAAAILFSHGKYPEFTLPVPS